MQAIKTKYLGPTNNRGSRIKASCERGSITIDYPYELSGENCHVLAIEALLARFYAEDTKRFGAEGKEAPHWWPEGYHIAQIENTGYIAVPIFPFNKFGGHDNEAK